ncbi:MAG: MFS transporter [Chloroflexi bacterium]|nr:MAG: MFS transporter [Chloroflexota bacterium]
MLTIQQEAPWANSGSHELTTTVILVILSLLSAFSPIPTRGGGTLTVTLAPLFGAVAVPLSPWAVMTVAAIGTIDSRIPGRQISWGRFLMNRGMYIFAAGMPSFLIKETGLTPWGYGAALALMLGLNTILIGIFFALHEGKSLVSTIRAAYAGNGLTYVALPLTGILVGHLLRAPALVDQLIVFLLFMPLLIYRASIQKQRRLDTWLRDSYIMQSRVVDKRDGQTFGHSQRVGELCEGVARLLRLPDDDCNTIRVGGILHDLGKIAIPDSILLKPGKLTPEEYEIIKTHPVEGAQILAEHPEQREVSEIVHHHHERWDGAGYPDGLKAEMIPVGSRIVNACDAFDTITQARVFRPTVKTPAEAIRELRQLAGSWYDPQVIGALERIVAERWGVAIADHSDAAQASPTYQEALAVRPFRMFWVGQAVSYFGDTMNTAGLAIMLFVLTRSASIVALGLIAKAIPTILFGLIAGPLVDRVNRQRLMIFADLARAILTVSIPFFGAFWLPGAFVAVFLIASASAFFNPAKQAILPNLVPGRLLIRANGLVSSSEKTMELLGYSLAGLIVAAVSWLPLFLIDAGTYLFSAISLLGVPDLAVRAKGTSLRLASDVVDGLRFVLRSAVLRSTMTLTLVVAVFFGMTTTLLVVMAYEALHGGASAYGFIEAAIGAGAIVGALIAGELVNRARAGTLLLLGAGGVGLANLLVGFSRNLTVTIIFLLLGGILNMIYYVPLISVTQRESPDHVRGRVMATRFLLVQGGYLTGMAVAGPLSDRLSAPVVFVVGGLFLIVAALLGVAFRSIRMASLRDDTTAVTVLKATASG